MLAVPVEQVRQMVMRHGWNTTAYQILNPGIDYWWNRDRTAVVGHVRRAGVLVGAGAPICAHHRLREVAAELERAAARRGEKVCYFCAAGQLEEIFRHAADHSIIAIGAQPVWNPAGWPEIVSTHASLRAQINRARNKSVAVAPESPAAHSNDPELRACLDQWLASRHLPPLHFMVEPQTLAGVVEDRRLWVARRPSPAGPQAVGFLLASPVPRRNGWLVEQIVRTPHAPNGTAELLIDTAIRRLAAEGSPYVTLGLVALASQAAPEMHANPRWLRILAAWAKAHGRRFYNFDGLDAFRVKLCPDSWETIYAISNEPAISLQTLYAVAAAFSAGSPLKLAAQTFARALAQEFRWLRQKLKHQ